MTVAPYSTLAVCLLLAIGCGHPPADVLYRRAEQYKQQDNLKLALETAEAGLRRENSWRFRLLKAELLVQARRAHEAMAILSMPAEGMTAEESARMAMYRGTADYLLSDYAAAEADLAKAREFAKSVNSALLDAEITLRLSTVQVREGHLADADNSLREVLKIAAAERDPYLQANATGNLGFMLMNSSRYDEAIYWFERARTAFESLSSPSGVTRTIGNLGWCYHKLGDDTKAVAYLSQAEQGFREQGNRYEQQIWLGNLGDALLAGGDVARAAQDFKDALAIARELGDRYWIGWWVNNLAALAVERKDFAEATRYNNEALEIARKNPENQSGKYPRVNQAMIAAGEKKFEEAEKLYRAVLSTPPDDPTPVLDAESGLTDLLIQQGDDRRAAEEFRAAIALIEKQRSALSNEDYKLSYLSSLIRFYQRYVDFLVSRGETEAALEAAEASRSRVLEERVGAAPRRSVSAASLRAFARASNSVLLSYWLGPERSFLWTVSPQGIRLRELPPEKQIAALVDGYRSFVENLRDPLASEYAAGRKLAEILLAGVDASRAVIVPDRALHSLNFETLADPKDPSHYLIDRMTIEIAPSLGTLIQPQSSRAGARSLLLIGDPEPVVDEYPKLPYASKEIELISKGLPVAQQVVLSGANAYPSAYRDAMPARFSWIHFAAHAAANRESPLDSALILSRHDAGYTLSARDVMNVPLNADLVTLSACRSAGAKTYSGEGLVGLSWAFLRAGARNVVAGLWDVTDLSTATLMSDFYEQLVHGATPADALRGAKLRMIRSAGAYRKPFYWGPFQLYRGSSNGAAPR